MSQREFRLFPEGTDQGETLLRAPQSPTCRFGELRKVRRAEVGHAVTLPVTPDIFGRVELRSISRKRGKNNVAMLSGQKVPDLATAMNRQPIPYDKQFPSDLTPQMIEEVQHLWRTDRSQIQPEIELPPCNAGNSRELLPVEMELQLWRLATRRPCSAYMRTLGNSAFVYKDDSSAFSDGFFLRAGHLYRFHRLMESSSRSMAFPEGRWQLHPRLRSNLQTCPGWYEIPQVSCMTSATRGRVHRQLLNPRASGPSSRTRFIWFRCRSLSRGLRPVRPADRNPAKPFSFNACAQRDTDISLTPTWRATSAWLSPFRKSTAASFRRCSRARMALPSRLSPFVFPMQKRVTKTECIV